MTARPARSADPRYFDFDAAFAEAEGATIPFRVLGKVYELPGQIPALVLLKLQRLMLAVAGMEKTGEVPEDFVVDEDLSYEKMCRDMAGDAIVDDWLAKGITYDKLLGVTRRLYAIHTGQDPDGETGKAPTVKQPQDRRPRAKSSPRKRSSSTGR